MGYDFLAAAHSGSAYCDGAVIPTIKRHHVANTHSTKSYRHSSIPMHNHTKHHHSHSYNPYSTISRAEIDKAISNAIADSHSGLYFADGALC